MSVAPRRLVGVCTRVRDYALGFLEVKANQSMTRLGAFACIAIGGSIARAAIAVSERPHLTGAHAEVVKALAALGTVFIAGGAVALMKRTKPEDLVEEKAS